VYLEGNRSSLKPKHFVTSYSFRSLQDLLESTVNGRAHAVALVEVDGSKGALADALGGELEFLMGVSMKLRKKEGEELTAYTSL
jgi:hypothetical protein